MKHHPDKCPDDPNAHETFQAIGQAYETLIDPNERASYDQYGPDGPPRGGGGGYDAGFEDMFEQMFGGGMGRGGFFDARGSGPGRGGRPKPRRGRNTDVEYKISLEEAYKGKKVVMALERDRICKGCKGRGGREGMKMTQCGKCAGEGVIFVDKHVGPGLVGKVRMPCTDCDGLGEHIREKDRCKRCKGKRVLKEKKRVEFWIEPGTEDGERIALKGEGDEEPDVPPGDVIFHIRIPTHQVFTRSHATPTDLQISITILLSEALLGMNRIVVTHLDGRHIRIESKQGERVITHGQELLIRGEGMPIVGRPRVKGDLWVKFKVEMPGASWAARQADGKGKVALPLPEDEKPVEGEVTSCYLSEVRR